MSEDPVRTNNGPGRRFLLAVIDGGGTVPPALGVAADLVRRGHQVRVLADPTIEVAALAAGCAFSPWQEAPHFDSRVEQTAMIAAVEGRNPYRLLRALRSFAGQGMTKRYADDVITTAQAFPVDAVLAEGAVPGIVIGALGTRLPTAALMPNIYLRPTVGSPLLGTGWRPGRGVMGRARDRLAPKAARWLLDRTLPRMNAVLTGYEQPPIRELFEVLDRCTRVLVMTSPSFDFVPARLPDNVRYVGPQRSACWWLPLRERQRNGSPRMRSVGFLESPTPLPRSATVSVAGLRLWRCDARSAGGRSARTPSFAEQRIELRLRPLLDEEARGDNDDAKPAAGDALLELLPVLWPAVNASVSAPSALPPGDLSGPVTLGDRRGPSRYPGALTR